MIAKVMGDVGWDLNPAEEGIMAKPLVPVLPLKREENASALLLTALNAVSEVVQNTDLRN